MGNVVVGSHSATNISYVIRYGKVKKKVSSLMCDNLM